MNENLKTRKYSKSETKKMNLYRIHYQNRKMLKFLNNRFGYKMNFSK